MAFFAPDIGIDLGTSNTVVYVRGRGIVISEPTMVVVDSNNKRNVRAVGDEAKFLLGRTSDALTVVRPLKGGSISDFDMTEMLIRYFIRKAIGVSHVIKPKVVVSIPVGLPAVSRKAVTEAAQVAGAKTVYLVEKPFAAAIGSGLPVYEPVGNMVVDIGGGTTDVAVVSLGGLVVAQSIQVGGVKMDEAIINYIKREFNMLIGDRTAEDVKLDLAAAMPLSEGRQVRIRGRDLLSPQAMDIEFTSAQAHEAIKEPCRAILAAIKWVLERTPPELAADIMRSGVHLTGGGAQLFAMDQFIATELGIPVLIAKEPEDCTVMGLGYLVENMQLLTSMGKQGFND
ncbi:MAG: rod shape-determining protein [Clostridia bacterium]|nr:rod shape-determining protein [Clostridia bacterium]MBQ7845103.1 rod shape-determining protein [Clostridia bacterium]